MENELGDGPLQIQYRQEMQDIAKAIDKYLNGKLKGNNRVTGFVLLVFPFGEKEGRCNYISNGADRDDIIKLLEEQASRFKAQKENQ